MDRNQTQRRSSVSIYDYPEHLNPFYEDDNHNKIRFWTINRKKPGRSNSFSFSGIRNAMTLRSFRGRKNSTSVPVDKDPIPASAPISQSTLRRPEPVARNALSVPPPRKPQQDVQGRYVYGGSVTPTPKPRFLHSTPLKKNDETGSQISVESTNPFEEPDRPPRTIKKKRKAPPPPTLLVTQLPDVSADDSSLTVELKITEDSIEPVPNKDDEEISAIEGKEINISVNENSVSLQEKDQSTGENCQKETKENASPIKEHTGQIECTMEDDLCVMRLKVEESDSKKEDNISAETTIDESNSVVIVKEETTKTIEQNGASPKIPPKTLPKPSKSGTPPPLPTSPPPTPKLRTKKLSSEQLNIMPTVIISEAPNTPPPSPTNEDQVDMVGSNRTDTVLQQTAEETSKLEEIERINEEAEATKLKTSETDQHKTIEDAVKSELAQLEESENQIKLWLEALQDNTTPLNSYGVPPYPLEENNTSTPASPEIRNSYYDNIIDHANNNEVKNDYTDFHRSISSSSSNGKHRAEINLKLNPASDKAHEWNPLPKPRRSRCFSFDEKSTPS